MDAQPGIDVLKIAVVADVYGGSGMHQIREEHIEVQILYCLQIGVSGIGEQAVVLRDEAQRKFLSELVVPLRPDDVIVIYGEM